MEEICEGVSSSLSATGANSYAWSHGLGGGSSQIVTPLSTTTYSVTGTDLNGCTNTSQVSIIVHPTPLVEAGPNDTIIEGFSTLLAGSASLGTPPYSYSWTPVSSLTDPLSLNPEASPDSTTLYQLAVSDAYGCVRTDTVRIFVRPPGPGIAGVVTYYNAHSSPLPGTEVVMQELGGTTSVSATSAGDGYYHIIEPEMGYYHYSVLPSASWGGGNAVDALLMLRHFVGYDTLKGLLEIAGDLDISGAINANDANLVAQRFTDNISSFPAGDWAYVPDTIAFDTSQVNYDISLLCMGDVNQSHLMTSSKWTAVESDKLPCITPEKNRVMLPVMLEERNQLGAFSIEVNIEHPDCAILSIHNSSQKGLFFSNIQNDQALRISWFDLNPSVFGPNQPLFHIELELSTSISLSEPDIYIKGEIADSEGKIIQNAKFLCPGLCHSDVEWWGVDIYPNPATDIIHLAWSTPGSLAKKVLIFDAIGRSIKTIELGDDAAEAGRTDLHCADILPGTYIVRIADEQGQVLVSSKVIFL